MEAELAATSVGVMPPGIGVMETPILLGLGAQSTLPCLLRLMAGQTCRKSWTSGSFL